MLLFAYTLILSTQTFKILTFFYQVIILLRLLRTKVLLPQKKLSLYVITRICEKFFLEKNARYYKNGFLAGLIGRSDIQLNKSLKEYLFQLFLHRHIFRHISLMLNFFQFASGLFFLKFWQFFGIFLNSSKIFDNKSCYLRQYSVKLGTCGHFDILNNIVFRYITFSR